MPCMKNSTSYTHTAFIQDVNNELHRSLAESLNSDLVGDKISWLG